MIQFRFKTAVIVPLFLIVATAFGATVFAQTTKPATPAPAKPTTPAPTAPVTGGGKVGVIDTGAFDAKDGLTRYSAAMDSVDVFFKKELDDLRLMQEKFASLEKELGALQQQIQAGGPNSATLQTTYTTKAEEYERLGRELKFKQDDLKVRYQNKRNEVVGPVLNEISVALGEFAKQNGFVLLLDLAKLGESNTILMMPGDDTNVTKQFIQFFNARPPKPAPPK